MMISKLRIFFIALSFALTANVLAQSAASDTTVSFVNFYPGHNIYELEGHSVLHISIPEGDFAVSYGTYDFEQPNFVYRFVKGETDYWVTVVPWHYMVNSYRRAGRRIVEHRLDMSHDQKQKLIGLINTNLQPKNRTYRYNYVKDNCATRPLNIIQLAFGDSIILGKAPNGLDGDETFRSIMRHYHSNYPWYQFGIDLALGCGIDYIIDNREKAFAPVVLDHQLRGATANGKAIVISSEVINDVAEDNAVSPPTPWYASPIFVSWVLFFLIALCSIRDLRRGKVTRWVDATLYAVFGLAGLLISFLIFISVHEATSPNILLLWLNPLCFMPTIFIWINRCRLIIFSYQIVNFVALIILASLWIAGVQALNYAFIPLVLCDAIRSATYIYLNFNKLKCQK